VIALVVLLGPASAYAAIAIVNAVLIGVSQRVPQMRTARLLGATPAQVRRALAWEAGLVGGAALALLPNGQVLSAGGGRLANCSPKGCGGEPVASAELYTLSGVSSACTRLGTLGLDRQ
jgi:putative ABC transport system permease protein